MSSRIEQLIDEIEEYIDGCKYQTFSDTKIIVNKEEIDELLRELRMKTPDEIKRYQKIISNKEAILNDARAKAEALINEATLHTNQLINEHEIMQQAYTQANEVVTATMEANSVRSAAMQYTDDILANVEALINQTMKTTTEHYESFMAGLNHYNDVVNSNRVELNPPEPDKFEAPEGDLQESTTGSINVDML